MSKIKSDGKPFRKKSISLKLLQNLYICIYLDILSTFDGPNFKRLWYIQRYTVIKSMSSRNVTFHWLAFAFTQIKVLALSAALCKQCKFFNKTND